MTAVTTTKSTSSKKHVNGQKPEKWVYLFDEVTEARAAVGGAWDEVRALLGGKGANLAEMTHVGITVPPGFTITTKACNAYLANNNTFPEQLWDQALEALHIVGEKTGKRFGSAENPLLLSVRSGAKFSMPGMMDTVLNLGMNDTTAEAMIKLTGDERFVYDSYRRLVQMFGCVVMGIADEAFEDYLTEVKQKKHYKSDVELSAEDWRQVTAEFKRIYHREVGAHFPTEPLDQMKFGIEAVFKSWNG